MRTHSTHRRWLIHRLLWLAILNIPVFFVILGLFFTGRGMPSNYYAFLYSLLAAIGHAGFFSGVIALITILLSMGFSRQRRFSIVWSFFSASLITYLICDNIVYHLFSYHIDWKLAALMFSKQGRDVLSITAVNYLVTAGILLVAFALEMTMTYFVFRQKKVKSFKLFYYLAGLAGLSWLFANTIYAVSYAKDDTPVLETASRFPLYRSIQANKLLKPYISVAKADAAQGGFLAIKNEDQFQYPTHPLHDAPPSQPPNVLFIVVDSWRRDTFDATISPHIAEFSKRSLVFKDHSSGGNMTSAGLFSLFYGIPVIYWDTAVHKKVSPVFMDVLKTLHYRFEIHASAPLDIPFAFDKTIFQGVPHLPLRAQGNSISERDEYITRKMLHFLDRHQGKTQPFFGFLFYDSAHGYDIPPEFNPVFKPFQRYNVTELNNTLDPKPYKNLYKNSVFYIDGLVQRIIQRLESGGYLKNTIVVITADHGELFNENHQNQWHHGGDFTKYQFQVPLIIYWPGYKPRVISYPTNHYDVMATLLQQVFHVKNPMSDYSIGQSLFHPPEKNYLFVGSAYGQSGVVGSKDTLVLNQAGFSYITDRDNGQRRNKKNPKEMDYAWEVFNQFQRA